MPHSEAFVSTNGANTDRRRPYANQYDQDDATGVPDEPATTVVRSQMAVPGANNVHTLVYSDIYTELWSAHPWHQEFSDTCNSQPIIPTILGHAEIQR